MTDSLEVIHQELIDCYRCPRLVAWREKTAQDKVRRYREEPYWGRPVPGFGDPAARVMVVGLAPAAHGGNRTGRMFTGDSSGDWLMQALWETGFANQPTSVNVQDGLRLHDLYLTAAVHCAPPDNRPTPEESRACAPYLRRELALVRPQVIVALGQFAQDAVKRILKLEGLDVKGWHFAHGQVFRCDPYTLIASYHPSRQNTQTGKLSHGMLKEVFETAKRVVDTSERY